MVGHACRGIGGELAMTPNFLIFRSANDDKMLNVQENVLLHIKTPTYIYELSNSSTQH